MANSLQAKKEHVKTTKDAYITPAYAQKLEPTEKKFSAALSANDVNAASEAFKQVSKILDKYAGSTIISKNTASRYKSRASAALKAMQKQLSPSLKAWEHNSNVSPGFFASATQLTLTPNKNA